MQELLELDREWLLYFNSLNAPWADPVMFLLTRTTTWIPFYLFLLYLVIKDYKKETWIVLIGAGITILLADQVTSSIMKPYFARFRPSHEPALQGLLHIVNEYRGGLYGFASGHAANTFGIATFFWLLFQSRYKWIGFMFLWAAFVTYTRIYLGVHYPSDVLVGGVVGILSGTAGYLLFKFLQGRYGKSTDTDSGHSPIE